MNAMVLTTGPVAAMGGKATAPVRRQVRNPRVGVELRPRGGRVQTGMGGARLSRADHPVPRNAARTAVRGAGHRRRDALVVAMVVLGIVLIGVLGFQLRSLSAAPAVAGETTVQVEPGDTLFSIAEKAAPGVPTAETVGRIRSMNQLPDTTVRAGQSLRVPVAAVH